MHGITFLVAICLICCRVLYMYVFYEYSNGLFFCINCMLLFFSSAVFVVELSWLSMWTTFFPCLDLVSVPLCCIWGLKLSFSLSSFCLSRCEQKTKIWNHVYFVLPHTCTLYHFKSIHLHYSNNYYHLSHGDFTATCTYISIIIMYAACMHVRKLIIMHVIYNYMYT